MAKPQSLIILCIALALLPSCRKNDRGKEGAKYPQFTAEVDESLSPWTSGQEISICDNYGGAALYVTSAEGRSVPLKYLSGDRLKEGAGVVYRANWPPAASSEGGLDSWQELSGADALNGIPLQARGPEKTLVFHPNSGMVKLRFLGGSPRQAAVELSEGTIHIAVPQGMTEGLFWVPEGEHFFKSIGIVAADRKISFTDISSTVAVRSDVPAELPAIDISGASPADNNLTGSARTANCYIAIPGNSCRFYAKCKGNQGMTADVFSPVWADIIWQDGMMLPALCDGEYIYFKTSGEEGNALVAARDQDGKVLWSWHIWVESDAIKGVSTAAGTIMDRDLGALSASQGDSLSCGLFYQWGRKEPVRASEPLMSEAETDDLAWSASVKTINDPCPDGWRIMPGGGHGVSSNNMAVSNASLNGFWSNYFGSSAPQYGSSAWISSGDGISGILPQNGLWIPASGIMNAEGVISGKGFCGSLWTAYTYAGMAGCLAFGESGYISPVSWSNRAAGRAVRCIKE